MKTCSKCKIEKPFEDFHRNKGTTDGLQVHCIECNKLRRLELKKNPLMQLEKQIRSSVILENKLLKRENKKLCTKCKEVFLIDDLVGGALCKECSIYKGKENYEKNKERMNECAREYRLKNKEKAKEYKRKYHEKNKEKLREYLKEYRLKNNEKINEKRREQQKEYRLKKKTEMQNNT